MIDFDGSRNGERSLETVIFTRTFIAIPKRQYKVSIRYFYTIEDTYMEYEIYISINDI